MKKIITIIATIAIASVASAQSLSGVKVGAGLSLNPYSYSPKGDWEPSLTDGYHIFASYPFAFTQRSAVTVGLRWEQTFNYKELNYVKDSYTRGFLSIPVKYEVHFGGFFVNLGPTFSFWTLFKDTISNKGSKISVNMFSNEHDGNQLNKFDIALGGEIGYDWKHIGVSLGYDYGLLKGIKSSANPITNFNRQAIRLSAAYIF